MPHQLPLKAACWLYRICQNPSNSFWLGSRPNPQRIKKTPYWRLILWGGSRSPNNRYGRTPHQSPETSHNLAFLKDFICLKRPYRWLCKRRKYRRHVCGGYMTVKPVPGILRPCISSVLLKLDGGVNVILDVGSNADCKPDVLYQFGILGSLLLSMSVAFKILR